MKKYLSVIAMLLALALCLCACVGPDTGSSTPPANNDPDPTPSASNPATDPNAGGDFTAVTYTGKAVVGEAGTYAAIEVDCTIELVSATECIITCAPVGQQGAYKTTYTLDGNILTIGDACVSSDPSGLEACYAAIYVKQFQLDNVALTCTPYSGEEGGNDSGNAYIYTGKAIVGEAGTYAAIEVDCTIELISATECIITCAPVGQQGAYKTTYTLDGNIMTIGDACVSSDPSGLEACYAAIYVKSFTMDNETMTCTPYSPEG